LAADIHRIETDGAVNILSLYIERCCSCNEVRMAPAAEGVSWQGEKCVGVAMEKRKFSI